MIAQTGAMLSRSFLTWKFCHELLGGRVTAARIVAFFRELSRGFNPMVAHNDQFSQGIAMVLRGESLKASCYVTHAQSLGFLREKMVSSFIRHETPEKFRVETGLVRNHEKGTTSRQCDLLIHEPVQATPLYRWDDFVVVHHHAARAVVEVKSQLFREEFTDLFKVNESVVSLYPPSPIPTFGYGLTGASIDSCAEYIRNALEANRLNFEEGHKHFNWPACFVIQDRHCIGVCPVYKTAGTPIAFCLVDLIQAEDPGYAIDGMETGFFLQIYTAVLAQRMQALQDQVVYRWFNDLPIKPDGKRWVMANGQVGNGNIPL
jgi:hypothetical protein